MHRQAQPNDTQRRALINLRQLSETTWRNQQKRRTPEIVDNKQILQRMQKSKQQLLRKKMNKKPILSFKSRPHTIHHTINFLNNSLNIDHKNIEPFTSLNFYQENNSKQVYNSIELRTKINSQIEGYVKKIKLTQTEEEKVKNNIVKFKDNSNDVRTRFRNKSQAYSKLKNYLFQSFKIDGKNLNINKNNNHSIDAPDLFTKKSFYMTQSLIRPTSKQYQGSVNKTHNEKLFKKVHRYQIDNYIINNDNNQSQNYVSTKNSIKINENKNIRKFQSYTMQIRGNSKCQKTNKGRLWLGRPPIQVITKYQD